MKKLKILHDKKAEGYIDVVVLVLCAVLVIALAVKVFPVYITKLQLDNFADELNGKNGTWKGISVHFAMRPETIAKLIYEMAVTQPYNILQRIACWNAVFSASARRKVGCKPDYFAM